MQTALDDYTLQTGVYLIKQIYPVGSLMRYPLLSPMDVLEVENLIIREFRS